MKTIKTTILTYNKTTRTFTGSEKDIQFASRYIILNPKTNKGVIFDFSHSTGPEFDPNTKYIYKSEDGLILEVCNDDQITKRNAEKYLKAKTHKPSNPWLEFLSR
jgi:hypothetical protein